MPVRFDDYEVPDRWTLREGSNPHRVLSFLLEHPETGFTPSEIADATDVPRGSVGPTLQRLRDRGLVRHKEPYWAAADDERVAAYEASLSSMEALEDRYGHEGWTEVDSSEQEADESELEAWRWEGE